MKIDWDCLVKDLLRQWIFIILAAVGAALLMSAFLQYRYEPVYQTSTTFVIGKNGFSNNMIYENLNSAEETTSMYSHIVESTILRKDVCEELGLDSFDATTEVTTVPSSNLMVMTVSASTPKLAYDISRSISENASNLMDLLGNNVTIHVISEPNVSTTVSNPLRPRRYMEYAALIAACAAVLLFGLVSISKDTIKNKDDVERKLDIKLVGTLYHEKKRKLKGFKNKNKESLLLTHPLLSFRYVESCRMLASRLALNMKKDNAKVLMVTSVSENEGKSTVAANISVALAQEGYKVFLVDCDFRKPSQYKIFDIDKKEMAEKDLTNLIAAKENIQMINNPDYSNFHMVFSMKNKRKPWDKESMLHLRHMINMFKKYSDFVIIDTSPMALVADTEEYAALSDETLLVVRQDVMEAGYINDAIDTLKASGTALIGCVFNNVYVGFAERLNIGGKYSSYYGYSKYGYSDKAKD